jgi:putative ABC transport system permease protein
MWKVIRRGLRANKIRFALTGIAVVLGVAFISGTLVLTSTIGRSFDDLFANINKGTDAVVRAQEVLSGGVGSGGAQRPNIPESLLRVVKQVPSVQDAQGNIDFNKSYAQVVGRNGKALGGGGPPTAGIAWDPNPEINQFRLVSGHAPATKTEVVLDRHTATKGKFKVGDKVKILSALPPKFYRVSGVAKFGSVDSLLGAQISLFTLPEAQRINNAIGQFGQINVQARAGVSETQVKHDIQQALAEKGDGSIEVKTGAEITKENQDQVQQFLKFFKIVLLVFGVIALVVGAFIIYNTFSIVLAQRVREMALLRAIGASQGQVIGQIAGEAAVVGIVASAIGVAAGILLAIGLRSLMNAIGFGLPSTAIVIPPSAVIAGMVVGIAITMISAVVPAAQAARIPPIAAMRDFTLERPPHRALRFALGGIFMALGILGLVVGLFSSVDNAWVPLVAGIVAIFAGAYVLGPLFSRLASRLIGAPIAGMRGVPGSLAKENAARNPKRTTTTAIPLVIGVALVGFITIFAASASATVNHAVDTQFKTDFLITSGSGFNQGAGFSPDLARKVGKLDIVRYQTPVRFFPAGVNGDNTFLNASDPAASAKLVDFTDVAGTFADLHDDGIAISKRKADEQHWKLGDSIPVTFVKTGTTPKKVQYIYKENTFGDYFVTLAVANRNVDPVLDQIILVKMQPGVSAETGRKALDALLKPFPTAKLQDNAQYKEDQTKTFQGLILFIDALLFFSLFIALIGIANTLILSIHERTHEIGLLRAVGMGRSQVRSSIRWESVIVCLIGVFNGLVIGLFFGWILVRALRDEGFSQFAIAPAQLVIVVVLLALLSIAAAWFPARRAAKLDILRAISAE